MLQLPMLQLPTLQLPMLELPLLQLPMLQLHLLQRRLFSFVSVRDECCYSKFNEGFELLQNFVLGMQHVLPVKRYN
jgi:hypothetical protein